MRRQVLDEFQPMFGALDISDFYVRSFDTGNLSNEGGIARRARNDIKTQASSKNPQVRFKSETVKLVWLVHSTTNPLIPFSL